MDTPDSICRARPLLGTFVEIAASGVAGDELQAAVDAAFAAVAQVHRLMSFHDPQSDVSRLNHWAYGRTMPVHAWTYQVLQTAIEIHHQSTGLFDVAVAPLLQKRGLLPRRAHDGDSIVDPIAASDAIELLADGCVRYLDPRVSVDLGGIAKGFAVDRALQVLRERGLPRGLVNAGGDLAAFGAEPEFALVRHPINAGQMLCRTEISNAALASSGRVFDWSRSAAAENCAVFDPNTESPVGRTAGATVRASCCMIADALTKVVMIAREEAMNLLKRYRANALFVLESGDVWVTPDWQNAVRFAA